MVRARELLVRTQASRGPCFLIRGHPNDQCSFLAEDTPHGKETKVAPHTTGTVALLWKVPCPARFSTFPPLRCRNWAPPGIDSSLLLRGRVAESGVGRARGRTDKNDAEER